jgi:Fe-S cluster assembly iron-binding protein IscA
MRLMHMNFAITKEAETFLAGQACLHGKCAAARIVFAGGGPTGLTYKFQFVDALLDDDVILKAGEVKLVTNKATIPFLRDTVLDCLDYASRPTLVFRCAPLKCSLVEGPGKSCL